ncbi:MAG: ABC transporter substrate-binding protein [Thermoplasmata archaeon]|nr:ABC transporter substrate-binding protein [Thermoplasmata archaeon]
MQPFPESAAAAPASAPKKSMLKWIVLVIAVILVAVGVGAYALLPRAAVTTTIVYATSSEMVTLDPSTEFSNSILVLPNLYETLTLWNPAANAAKPLLATSWTHTPDGGSWTFTLRSGVKFHDGTAFDAAAVKSAILRTITMNGGAAYIWGPIGNASQAATNIQVIDTSTVKFTLLYPAALDKIASSGYAAYIFSPNTPGSNYTNQATWFEAGHDSGTGPYKLDPTAYTKTRVVMDRFADYWGGWKAGQFDHAIIKVYHDPAQREAAVLSGDADITIDVPLADLATLQANSRVSVLENPSYRAMYAFFNSVKAPTNNKSVRQALASAIPYPDIVSSVVNGLGTQSVGVIPATMWGHDATLPKFTFNLTRAQQLLAAGGHPGGGFTLNFTYTAGDLFEQKFGELYKEKLATLGVTLNVRGMPWEQQWALAKTDPATAQDVFVMYWWPTYVTPYDFLFNMFSYASYAFFNLGYYNNSAFDTKINDAVTLEATNPAQALTEYSQAQTMLYNDCPGVGVVDMKNLYLMKADLKGFADNPAYPLVVFFYQLGR